MRKFRLKLWYPGLPNEWKKEKPEIIVDQLYSEAFYQCHHLPNKPLSCDIVENNPLYWEEIIEPDYTILKFRCIDKTSPNYNRLSIVENNMVWFEGTSATDAVSLQSVLEVLDSFQEIYSVKNNKNGKIFTIGDRIKDKVYNYNGTISSMRIEDNSITLLHGPIHNNRIDYACLLNNAVYDTPLFTTSDGVDIYKGDSYYDIDANNNYYHNKAIVTGNYNDNTIRFSTEEAAKEYILLHKPVLCLQDIKDVYSSVSKYLELEKIVKSRIN